MQGEREGKKKGGLTAQFKTYVVTCQVLSWVI